MTTLYDWLQSLGLDRHAAAFAEQDIDFDILADLTERDLIELGLSFGERKKLRRAIARLSEDNSGSGSPSPDAPQEAVSRSGAEQRHLTVMFCDLVGSTELSIRYDPDDLRTIVRAYQDACAGVVARMEGFVARYMGDGVLVYFGFPRAHEDDAERAIRAGLEIVKTVARLRPQPDLRLQTRVGIGTGSVVVGDLVGVGPAQEIAAVGETPNVAARLQALAEPDSVVVDRVTCDLARDVFELESLGPKSLKGITLPVSAWQVTGPRHLDRQREAQRADELVPFVNRTGEMNLLTDRWQAARGGQGQVVLLAGEPGIGKSRLVRAFIERLSAQKSITLTYHCTAFHQNKPLHPLIERMQRRAGLSDDDPPMVALAKIHEQFKNSTLDAEEAVRLFAPLLSVKLAEEDGVSTEQQLDMERLLDVMLAETEAMAVHRPLMMIVEDLHWIDPTSLEFLQRLAQRISNQRIMLILTLRPEAEARMRPLFPGTGLSLDRLQRPECETIIRHIVQDKDFPQDLVDTIAERTDGVALFIEQLTKAVLESNAVVDLGDRYEVAAETPATSIPTTLRGSLLARLDRYPAAREVAQMGAVIGREFSFKMLATISDLSEHDLQRALDRLVEAQLLYQAGAPPRAIYRFKHALVQEMAYSSLLKKKRRRVHAQIAAFLEDRSPHLTITEPELLAHHYAQAVLPHRAIAFHLKAAERAILRSAMSEAVAEVDLGLALLPSITEAADNRALELRLRVAQATALRATMGTGARETGAAWAQALRLCENEADKTLLFRVLYGSFLFHQGNANLQEARNFGTSLLDLGAELNDDNALLRGHSAIGRTAFGQGDFAEARDNLEKAIALNGPARPGSGSEIGRPESPVLDLCYLSWTSFALGFPETALAQAGRALAIAEADDEAYALVVANGNACYLHQFCRDDASVGRCAERVVALAGEKGYPHWRSLGQMFQGWLKARGGDSAAGIEVFRQALAAHRATGEVLEVCYFLGLLAELLGADGAPEAGLAQIDEALEMVGQTGERWYEAELHRIRGALLLSAAEPEPARAEAEFQRALDLAGAQDARLWALRAAVSLAQLHLDHGDAAAARQVLEPRYAWFGDRAATAGDRTGAGQREAYRQGEDSVEYRKAAGILKELTATARS
ncbi:AAA family ATPase [Pelagibius sp.]|uniref:AAA family ATPase n=1 Tax=Pelagibius sp. TaxID=1931238 RepID=UPI00262EDD95|nr:AAA family ATPase [Pelagibius sp.]